MQVRPGIACFFSQDKQGGFGWVSEHFPTGFCPVFQRFRREQTGGIAFRLGQDNIINRAYRARVQGCAVFSESTHRFVASAGNCNFAPGIGLAFTRCRHPHRADRHFILGQRSGFISADNIGTAQGLHRGKFLDQGVTFRHALRAHRERQRDGRQQPFRNKRHDHAQCKNEAFYQGDFYQKQGDDQEQETNAYRDDRDDLGNVLHLLLQRAEFLFQGLCNLGDPAEVRVHAGGVDNCLAGASCHESARKY